MNLKKENGFRFAVPPGLALNINRESRMRNIRYRRLNIQETIFVDLPGGGLSKQTI